MNRSAIALTWGVSDTWHLLVLVWHLLVGDEGRGEGSAGQQENNDFTSSLAPFEV